MTNKSSKYDVDANIIGQVGDEGTGYVFNQGNMAAFDNALESLLAILRNNGVDGGAIDAVKAHAAQLKQAPIDNRPGLLEQMFRAVKDGLRGANKSMKEMADLYSAYETLAKAAGMAGSVIGAIWAVL